MTITKYRTQIREMKALLRITNEEDVQVLVLEAIVEAYDKMDGLVKLADKIPSSADLKKFRDRSDEKFKTPRWHANNAGFKTSHVHTLPDGWEVSEIFIDDKLPESTLNPDGKSRACKCGARHSLFPNTHMTWCPMKVWK